MTPFKITTSLDTWNQMHTTINVWQNGGLAGTLTVQTEHAEELQHRLQGDPPADLLHLASVGWRLSMALEDTLRAIKTALTQDACALRGYSIAKLTATAERYGVPFPERLTRGDPP